MPVYLLNKSLQMPPAEMAEADGLLAIGGDLSAERLLKAYKMGIFPWFNEGEEILWWSPDPRFVLDPKELKISKSMRSLINKNAFEVTIDKAFEKVIENCRSIDRKGQEGTWITEEMKEAYINLKNMGYGKSVEVWKDGELVGGLYGVLIGKIFFGESMFSLRSNASKYGFIYWVKLLLEWKVKLIDCQIPTDHLRSLGAKEIPRDEFLQMISENLP